MTTFGLTDAELLARAAQRVQDESRWWHNVVYWMPDTKPCLSTLPHEPEVRCQLIRDHEGDHRARRAQIEHRWPT